MRFNVLTYILGEGISNVFKNKKQAFTSLAVMCLTMLIFGAFFVIGQNLNYFIKQVEANQGLQVFMDVKATDEEVKTLETELKKIDGISSIELISKEDALQQMKDRFGKDATLLEGYTPDIFPISYVIKIDDLNESDQIQEQVKSLELVDSIEVRSDTINKLAMMARGARIGTFIILICLVLFSIFIVSNTIKLTVYARRREISIMKYVGATNSFIRWPFAVEGMLIGAAAGGISTGILYLLYNLILNNETFVKILTDIKLNVLDFNEISSLIIIVYLTLGIGIGAVGSTVSMRKYLKV